MLVLPAPSVVDVSKVSELLGKPVRLASESEFANAFPDCEPAPCRRSGTFYALPVYVDESLGRNERIVFQAGTHTVTMSVSYADFARVARPTTADVAVRR